MITTESQFHDAVHQTVGTPTTRYRSFRRGRRRGREIIPKRHASNWAEAKVVLKSRKVELSVYIDFQQNGLPQADYERLKQLACSGIRKYWSRDVDLSGQSFWVGVTVFHRASSVLDVDLAIRESPDYGRSHNTGIIDATLIYNKGFYRGVNADADRGFELTAAHEFGHSVLEFFGGTGLSWGHKASTHVLLQKPHARTPGYPSSGEIDLMKYYDSDKRSVSPKDRALRTKAAEIDVKRLIWMSALSFVQ